jgi:branched-chain amino acid aminotransferase
MPQRIVYFNGRFVPEREARVSIYDSALVWGDMAYEVTRTVHQRPFRLRDHLQRLLAGLAALRIETVLSLDDLEEITHETLARNLPSEPADCDWNIIHNVSRGPAAGFRDAFAADALRPTVIVSCYPLVGRLGELAPAYDEGLDLIVPRQRAMPGELLDDSIKTRSRLHFQLANLQAGEKRPGAWAVLVDTDGFLTECTNGNVFVVRAGELQTPHTRNLLPGITRRLVVEAAANLGLPCREADLTPADAAAADEFFVTSTSIGILHARSFEGTILGDGRVGPMTALLRTALAAEVGVDFAAQAREYAARTCATRRTSQG